MYCFQCGEELVKGAKFCHVCGANQEDARRLFEKKFKKSSPESHPNSTRPNSPGGDTKVAYSSDPEDGEYLKSYLDTVDTNVGQNLKKHETLSGISTDSTAEEQAPVNVKDEAPKVEPEEEPSVAEKTEPEADVQPKQKKKSFSEIWNRFIDEEDNPYSVFGEMADRLEKDETAISSTEADNLRISRDVEEDTFNQTGDVGSLNHKVNEILEEQEREREKEKITAKGILSSFFKQSPKEGASRKADVEYDAEDTQTSDSYAVPDSDDAPAEEIRAYDDYEAPAGKRADADDHSDAPPRTDRTERLLADLKARGRAFKERLRAKKEARSRNEGTESLDATEIYDVAPAAEADTGAGHETEIAALHAAAERLQAARVKVKEAGPNGLYTLIGIGAVLSAAPILFAFRGVSILAILFTILKVAIGIFAFTYANEIARNNTCRPVFKKTRRIDSLLHWILYLIPATLVFFLLPSSLAMGRTVLGAVTPHIILSILLYFWVIFLALASAQEDLVAGGRRDFIAWYGILFISIDLISKLFWILTIFITSTFA